MTSGPGGRRLLMALGFAAALCGDWLLAVKCSPHRSPGFLCGIVAFACAHVLWASAHLRLAKPDLRAFVLAGIPLAVFTAVRVAPGLPRATAIAAIAYSAITAFDFSVAVATRRRLYAWGVALLGLSDVMIGMDIAHVPGCGAAAGPVYVVAEACLVASCVRRGGIGRAWSRIRVGHVALWTAFGTLAAFTAAVALYPGAEYNPLMQMLSALGRTRTLMVDYPWSHYLFMLGMAISAAGIPALSAGASALPRFRAGRRLGPFRWGAALVSAGLATIALVPENVNMDFHNLGCWIAVGGGCLMLFAAGRHGLGDVLWRIWLVAAVAALGAFVALHAAGLTPFAPFVTTAQKVVIASFMAWCVSLTVPAWSRRTAMAAATASLAWLAAALPLALRANGGAATDRGTAPERRAADAENPLTADEHAALRWLEHVTGELSADEEREWWSIGGTQHGLFARRYSIAFAGYAAAALGQRGSVMDRQSAGRTLGNCIRRYVRKDEWAYSMSKDYWGRKPWAPDPCFRENVMYTGHLLQLLALYESFTGDRRYWTNGFDFVWSGAVRVHYTVEKLIDVTVHQMRRGPNGGLTCEPGLMFFPCNNHPHVALALFARMGHGDWSGDARRWERWALSHFRRPLLGGGALNLVYHVRSGLFYPMGNGGLDGWSLLWYEPWATDRGAAIALWNEVARKIDWKSLDGDPDLFVSERSCCHPADVPPVVTASFLAAAARACDDRATAEKLERMVDKTIVRRDGMLYLDVGREWRIGATANRIISLAESNGSSFRLMLKGAR